MTTPAAHAEIIRANIRCGKHKMSDCSPLLNGCSEPNQSHAALDALVAQAERAATLEAERDMFQNAQRHADARVVDLFARAEAAEADLAAQKGEWYAENKLRRKAEADLAAARTENEAAKQFSYASHRQRAEAAESALEAATETLREIVGAHTELDGATVSFGVQNRHVDRFVAAMGEARAFLARSTAGGKDEYPIRPIEKRGGYQPTAQGPPPTKPPPKPAGGKEQT